MYRAIATAALLLVVLDLCFVAAFPRFGRLRYNFSSAYLARSVREARGTRPVVVLGDSVMWGYGVSEAQTAVALASANARATGAAAWSNYAFAGGSAANSLAVLDYLIANGVRPRRVIFNLNEKTFDAEDSAYRRLHPAVEELASSLLPGDVGRSLEPTLERSLDARTDRAISRTWRFYGMRADLRDALFDDADFAHAVQDLVERASGAAATIAAGHRPTPEKFEGTYDLDPIGGDNAQFVALRDLTKALRSQNIPSVAILTPTNHRLLHDYIDVPQYRANLALVSAAMRRDGIRVLDLDRAFRPDEFIDNDHLTPAGNRHLAAILIRAARS